MFSGRLWFLAAGFGVIMWPKLRARAAPDLQKSLQHLTLTLLHQQYCADSSPSNAGAANGVVLAETSNAQPQPGRQYLPA